MKRTNIYNKKTGLTGYQIPGATLTTDWEWINPIALPKIESDNQPTPIDTEQKKPVPIISTNQAIPELNKATEAQDADLVQLSTEQKNKEINRNNYIQSIKNQGGLTADEIAMTGGDLNNYNFVSSAGLYLPKQTLSVQEQYQNDLDEIDSVFNEQIGMVDQSAASIMSSINSLYSGLANDQKQINATAERGANTVLMRMGVSRYAPMQANTILTNVAKNGLNALSEIAAKQTNALAEANIAIQEKKYNIFVKKREEINALKKERLATLQKLQEEAQKKKDEAQKQMIQVSRDSAVADLIEQGVTDPAKIMGYLNYDSSGNLVGDFTADEINKTLTNLIGKSVDLGADGNMFKFAMQQGWLPEGSTIFDYWKLEKNSKSTKSESGGMGAGGFDQFSKESIAMSVLPPTLRNSDAEKAYYLEGIRSGLNSGKTPYEIADVLMGYNITEPSAFSEGLRKYISIAGTTKNIAPEVARLVNAGAYDKAISVVENEVYNKAKSNLGSEYVSESTTSYYATKVKEIKDLIQSNGLMDAIGPIEGSASSVFSKVPLTRRREAAKVQAKVTSLVAEMRNHLSGTAVTESEQKFLEPLIASLSDKKGIFINKLDEISGNALTRLNAVRTQYELPEINQAQLLDRKLRIPAYSSQTAFDPAGLLTSPESSVVDPNDPEGLFK